MLRRLLSDLFGQVVRPPVGRMPPLPRPRGFSLATAGEQVRRRPEPAKPERADVRRARPAAPEPAHSEAGRWSLADELASPEEVRRAFVLMEVLGPPVSLRERRDDPGKS